MIDFYYDQGSYPYGHGNWFTKGCSIRGYGCGLCSISTALRVLTDDDYFEPLNVAKDMNENDGGNVVCSKHGMIYRNALDSIERAYGVKTHQIRGPLMFEQAINDGHMIISGNSGKVFRNINGNLKTHGGHIVCFHGKDEEGNYLCSDPQKKRQGGPNIKYSQEDIERWCLAAMQRSGWNENNSIYEIYF